MKGNELTKREVLKIVEISDVLQYCSKKMMVNNIIK